MIHVETLAGIFVGVTWILWAIACCRYRMKWLEEKKAREREVRDLQYEKGHEEEMKILYEAAHTKWKCRAYDFADAVIELTKKFEMHSDDWFEEDKTDG